MYAGLSRHLISGKKGSLTTLCGCTGAPAEVWRGNTTKPECRKCLEILNSPISSLTVEVAGGYNYLKVEGGYTESDSAYTKQELLEQQRAITIERGDTIAIGTSSHSFIVTRFLKGGGFKATHVDDDRIKLVVYRNELDDVVIIEKHRS